MSEEKTRENEYARRKRRKKRVVAVVWEAGCLEADIFRTGIINRT